MSGPVGGRLADLSRRATRRAAALTDRATEHEADEPAAAPPGSAVPAVAPAAGLAPAKGTFPAAGAAPGLADPLALVLYSFGSCPIPDDVDPGWPSLLLRRAEAAVRHDLAGYTRTHSPGWASWTHHGCDTAMMVHKVYASPAVAALPQALPLLFRVAIAEQVPAWKVGATLPGLHRADKVVFYLPSRDRAETTAAALDRALAGLPAQGVPFTGQVGRSGAVSRGLDRDATSWRALLCAALAEELHHSRALLGAEAPATDVATLALELLAAHGWDTTTWAPDQTGTPATSTTTAPARP